VKCRSPKMLRNHVLPALHDLPKTHKPRPRSATREAGLGSRREWPIYSIDALLLRRRTSSPMDHQKGGHSPTPVRIPWFMRLTLRSAARAELFRS